MYQSLVVVPRLLGVKETLAPFLNMSKIKYKQKQPLSKKAQRRVNTGKKVYGIASTIAAKEGLVDKKPVELLKLFRAENQEVLKAMAELKTSLQRTVPEGPSMNELKAGIMAKMRVPFSTLKSELLESGVKLEGVTDKQLAELILLDDWGTIAKTVLPFAIKHGVPVLKSLWTKHVAPRIKRYMGGDEGINPMDWGAPSGMQAQRFVPGVNVTMPGVKDATHLSSLATDVSTHSIRSLLCPELYKHRYTTIDTQKTALGSYIVEYELTSSPSGLLGVVLTPGRVVSSSVPSFLDIYNDTTFSVAGTQIAACVSTSGPFYASQSSIEVYRVTGFSWELKPIASISTTGSYVMGYANRQKQSRNTTTDMGISLANMRLLPYSVSVNNRTNTRMIMVHGASSGETEFVTNSSTFATHQAFIYGVGLPNSTVVAKLQISIVLEFIPSIAAYPLCVTDFPQPGPMTEQFESLIMSRYQVLQSLTLDDARKIAEALPEQPISYNTLASLLDSLVVGITPLERPGLGGFSYPSIAIPSVEQIEFDG